MFNGTYWLINVFLSIILIYKVVLIDFEGLENNYLSGQKVVKSYKKSGQNWIILVVKKWSNNLKMWT
jgi:hypothetical protein